MAIGLLAVLVAAGCSSSAQDDTGSSPGSSPNSESSVSPSPSAGDGPASSGNQDGDTGSASKAGRGKAKAQSAQNVALDDGDAGEPTRDGRQQGVFNGVPGNRTAACVDVGAARDIRSGSFIGGAFDEARTQFGTKDPGRKVGQVRLYWIPMHAKGLSGVTITMTRLSNGQSTTVHQKRVADADQWKFYDTLLKVDTAGHWRFEVKSGQDRGCFEAEFG